MSTITKQERKDWYRKEVIEPDLINETRVNRLIEYVCELEEMLDVSAANTTEAYHKLALSEHREKELQMKLEIFNRNYERVCGDLEGARPRKKVALADKKVQADMLTNAETLANSWADAAEELRHREKKLQENYQELLEQNDFICELNIKVARAREAAEHREKVAMRALEAACKHAKLNAEAFLTAAVKIVATEKEIS